MANVSSWVESAFRLPPLLSSLGNRPLALEAFSWGTNFANRLSGFLCYPGTTLTQLRSGTALYSHPPGEEPTESVSVASAADKNFTLLSCCCCCLLILLLPEPNTHNRATSTQKKTPPAAESTPSVKVRQQQQSAAVTSNVKITQFHAHHHRPRFTRTSFRRPQKKTTRERTIQGGAATASLDRVLGHFRARSGATHGRTRRPGVSRERFHRNGNSLGHFAANGNGIRRGPDGAPQPART